MACGGHAGKVLLSPVHQLGHRAKGNCITEFAIAKLTGIVNAPTANCTRAKHHTGVAAAGGDCDGVGNGRNRDRTETATVFTIAVAALVRAAVSELAIVIESPTPHGAGAEQGTRVPTARGYGDGIADARDHRWWRRKAHHGTDSELPDDVVSPALHRARAQRGARVIFVCVYRNSVADTRY
jgi:hypothetical protein